MIYAGCTRYIPCFRLLLRHPYAILPPPTARHIFPISDALSLRSSTLWGAVPELTPYLIKVLLMHGYDFNHTPEFETICEIKEKLSYVGSPCSSQ